MDRAVAEAAAAARAGCLARVANISVEILRHRRFLMRELHREPTAEELAQATGLSVSRIREVRDFRTGPDGSPEDEKRLETLAANSLALDAIC